jgi:hypothetical protein
MYTFNIDISTKWGHSRIYRKKHHIKLKYRYQQFDNISFLKLSFRLIGISPYKIPLTIHKYKDILNAITFLRECLIVFFHNAPSRALNTKLNGSEKLKLQLRLVLGKLVCLWEKWHHYNCFLSLHNAIFFSCKMSIDVFYSRNFKAKSWCRCTLKTH